MRYPQPEHIILLGIYQLLGDTPCIILSRHRFYILDLTLAFWLFFYIIGGDVVLLFFLRWRRRVWCVLTLLVAAEVMGFSSGDAVQLLRAGHLRLCG